MTKLLTAALLFSATTVLAAARTFVSAEVGADTNPCTRSLPCRSFAVALLASDSDGEVVVLDSGGYGPVTITQAVSIVSPQGVHAGVTSMDADGITVSAGDAASVLLKNLAISDYAFQQNPTAGIRVNSVHTLNIEGCSINGFDRGIAFDPTTANARLYVTDCVIRRSYMFTTYGIHIASPNLAARAVIDSTQIYDCDYGIYLQNAQATVRDCVTASGSYGYYADFQSGMVVTRSVAKDMANGFTANNGSTIVVNRCLANMNSIYGVAAFNTSNVYVSGSTLVENYQAAFGSATGAARTRGNNTTQKNSHSDGAFTIAFSAR
jgi:hypothetical protein